MRLMRSRGFLRAAVGLCLLSACGKSDTLVVGDRGGDRGSDRGRDEATGGSSGTGGTATGGAGAGKGGGGATGGAVGTGGGKATGGALATGGSGGSGGSAGTTATGGAKATGGAAGGTGGTWILPQVINRQLDLIFMVDNSSSMAPLQAQMTKNLPDFMNVLKDPATGGLPDLHVGVISSDLGAARSLVPGCMRIGGDLGAFQATGRNPPGCMPPGDKYIIDTINPDGSRATNFGNGDITDVFSCVALLGQTGCGFESQLGSVLAAVSTSPPSGNEQFLRPDAFLAVVMLTNEDDCTAPADSDLFNPNMTDPTRDAYGALQSYRCTEFGIQCDQAMPHLAPATPQLLTNCRSKEDGRLLKVADFVNQLKASRPDPRRIFFGAIAALQVAGAGTSQTPYAAVRNLTVSPGQVGGVAAPILNHVPGCEAYAGDAALRIWDAVKALDGVFQSICQDDYAVAMRTIAKTISSKLVGAACIDGPVAQDAMGNPSCRVVDRTFDSNGVLYTDLTIPHCAASGSQTPCWQLVSGGACLSTSRQLQVVRSVPVGPSVRTTATCDLCLPGSSNASCL